MTLSQPLRGSLAAESFLFAGRLVKIWRRDPLVLIQAVVFPTFLLITYKLLLGKSIIRITGTDSLYGLVPMCSVAGGMFGAFAAAHTIRFEREWGLLTRFWRYPINRASPLAGRLLADAVRTFLSSVLITAVGVALGLRFNGGWLYVIPFLIAPVIVGVIFSMAVIAIAMRSNSSAALVWLAVPSIGAVFSSSGVPPAELLPAWMSPLIHLNPMTPTIDFMRGLALAEPVLGSLLVSLTWAIGLTAVLGPLAVSGYRAAARVGG
ncbi:MAG: ABC transporter permease [Verrucomicrobiota bacterium]|jgi:ABC-2 type transport system permease protein